MKNLLLKLARWIVQHYQAQPLFTDTKIVERKEVCYPACWLAATPFVSAAKAFSHEWNKKAAPGTSGEYKRHQVYAKLIRLFPSQAKSDLALAIELAIQRR